MRVKVWYAPHEEHYRGYDGVYQVSWGWLLLGFLKWGML